MVEVDALREDVCEVVNMLLVVSKLLSKMMMFSILIPILLCKSMLNLMSRLIVFGR